MVIDGSRRGKAVDEWSGQLLSETEDDDEAFWKEVDH